jgi:hypothetical protein
MSHTSTRIYLSEYVHSIGYLKHIITFWNLILDCMANDGGFPNLNFSSITHETNMISEHFWYHVSTVDFQAWVNFKQTGTYQYVLVLSHSHSFVLENSFDEIHPTIVWLRNFELCALRGVRNWDSPRTHHALVTATAEPQLNWQMSRPQCRGDTEGGTWLHTILTPQLGLWSQFWRPSNQLLPWFLQCCFHAL